MKKNDGVKYYELIPREYHAGLNCRQCGTEFEVLQNKSWGRFSMLLVCHCPVCEYQVELVEEEDIEEGPNFYT